MNSLRLPTVITLVRQDLYYAIRSARGLLFLVFFAVFWLWLFSKLTGGAAQWLANPEGNVLIGWLFDPKVARSLFVDRSPTLSAFFLLAVSTVPVFVLFAASDQTANDIGSKYLRFLTPRCNRIEIFVARFLGATLLVALAYIVITAVATVMAIVVDNTRFTTVLLDSVLVMLSLVVYALPFIALMSLCSVVVGSAGLSALVGISVYVVVLVIVAVIEIKMPQAAEWISYLIPNATKGLIIQLQWSQFMQALMLVPLYVAFYGFMGWRIFSKRDI
ncbi:hypothetical protein [Marinicella litoralis]|uniref:ABC-2 type transport system permease protein n=1 Tax=Marinicella litoralis TaxID=644220 RepID=A0A4R6XR98_9GAMM|nr:hypothetical protein [Marinicella litoralis]TDR22405.1 hypothetical protein C8D91_0893 [Marinicella litoralis]